MIPILLAISRASCYFGKNNISLLESLGGDQSVHLLDLDAVKLLALLLDSLLHSDSFTCDGKGLGKLESNLVPDLLFPGRVGSLLYSCSRLLCSLFSHCPL